MYLPSRQGLLAYFYFHILSEMASDLTNWQRVKKQKRLFRVVYCYVIIGVESHSHVVHYVRFIRTLSPAACITGYSRNQMVARKSSVQNTVILFGDNCFPCLVVSWVGGCMVTYLLYLHLLGCYIKSYTILIEKLLIFYSFPNHNYENWPQSACC